MERQKLLKHDWSKAVKINRHGDCRYLCVSPWPCRPPRPAWSWCPGLWWRWWRCWPASAPAPLSTLSLSTSCEVSTSWGQLSTAASRQNCRTLSTRTDTLHSLWGRNSQNNNTRDFCVLMIVSTHSAHSNIETSTIWTCMLDCIHYKMMTTEWQTCWWLLKMVCGDDDI